METTGCWGRAGFSDMVAIIEQHVNIFSDPFFGDLQDYSSKATPFSCQRPQLGKNIKGNIVASTVTSVSASGERNSHLLQTEEVMVTVFAFQKLTHLKNVNNLKRNYTT